MFSRFNQVVVIEDRNKLSGPLVRDGVFEGTVIQSVAKDKSKFMDLVGLKTS
jgi:hypothetical protein